MPRDFEKLGVTVSHDIDEVLPTADVVNLLRIQHERQRKEYFPGLGEYIRLFGLTKERAKLLKPDCLIMHPGPINRGVEIDSEVADGNAKRHSRPGHQRSRRAHGCSLSLRRDRNVSRTSRLHPGSARVLACWRRIAFADFPWKTVSA